MRAWLATELQILKPNLQLTKYSFVPSGFFLFAFKDILDSTNEQFEISIHYIITLVIK